MTNVITNPSIKLPEVNLSCGGKDFGVLLGNANIISNLSYSAFREFCCWSKICLNITRWSHPNAYASVTAHPFELEAYCASIVSQPYNGIEEWFDVGKEFIALHSEEKQMKNKIGFCYLIPDVRKLKIMPENGSIGVIPITNMLKQFKLILKQFIILNNYNNILFFGEDNLKSKSIIAHHIENLLNSLLINFSES